MSVLNIKMNANKNSRFDFDLEEFILKIYPNAPSENLAEDGMVERLIFNEMFFCHLALDRYRNQIKFDGKAFWFYDSEASGCYWKEDDFIIIKVWENALTHFKSNKSHYETVLNKHFEAKNPPTKVKELDKETRDKVNKSHPFIIFNKFLNKLHKNAKCCLSSSDYMATLTLDNLFISKCNPVGFCNVFQMKKIKEEVETEIVDQGYIDETGFHYNENYEESFIIKEVKVPVMIDLKKPYEILERSPADYMTDELDVIVGESSDDQLEELDNILFNICNSNHNRKEQILLGYALALQGTDTAYSFCHFGGGSNGKSILKALIQTTYKPMVLNVDSNELLKSSKGKRDKFHSSLAGKRILLVEELDEQVVDTEELKILSGNSEITHNALYRQHTIDIPYRGRLFIYKNNELNVGTKGNDGGLARRIKAIEHTNKFVSSEDKENNKDVTSYIVGDSELEHRILNKEYVDIFFDLMLNLIKKNIKQEWASEFGKETLNLLNDSQSYEAEWCDSNLERCQDEKITLHDIMDAMEHQYPPKVSTFKNKIKQYMTNKHPDMIENGKVKECSYKHKGKTTRGLHIYGMKIIIGSMTDELDELDYH